MTAILIHSGVEPMFKVRHDWLKFVNWSTAAVLPLTPALSPREREVQARSAERVRSTNLLSGFDDPRRLKTLVAKYRFRQAGDTW
jgi:hypothetical protein